MRFRVILSVGLAVAVSATARAGVVLQGAGNNFAAFEAESYQGITNTAGRQWIEVSTASPITSPVGNQVIPASSNVSGDVALLANFNLGGHESTVTYRIKFQNPGTYRLYTRYSMYESSSLNNNYGNEDSYYRPADFDQVPLAGDTNIVSGFATSNVEGVYGWHNSGANYTVDAADAAAPYV